MYRFLALFTLLLVSNIAFAQSDADRAMARASFQRGVAAYEAANYPDALEAFQRAYEIAPHPVVRVNIANCLERVGRPADALTHYEAFLREMGDQANAEQQQEVGEAVRRLNRRVGELSLTVTPSDATVTIDGREVHDFSQPVRLEVGRRLIVAEREGYRTITRRVRVEAGQRRDSRLVLQSENEASPVTEPDVPEPVEEIEDRVEDIDEREDPFSEEEELVGLGSPDDGSEDDEDGWFTAPVAIVGAATIGLAAGAVALGVMALGSEDSHFESVDRANDTSLSPTERDMAWADAQDHADRANRRALISDILSIAAVAGAVTTVLLIVLDGDDEDEQGLAIAPVIAPGTGGVSLRGSF